jgi:putative ABC transport system permease protein
VIVVLAALEVTLLAGAAFAVGARRQARSLGLVAAAGGSRNDVRRVVLAGGVVLGAAGAVIGTGLGLLLAAAAMPLLAHLADTEFGHYDVRPLEVLAIAAVGLGTGIMAAVLPARTAARQDPVVALTGRRGQVRTARKVPVIGVAITIIGVGAAALGSALAIALTTGLNPTNGGGTAVVAGLIAGGAALAQIGLIVTSPAIIGLVGRLGSRLPLPARLAVRDAARHRGRSAPAMAAVLTAVTGSTALLLYVTALDASDRVAYSPAWPTNTAGLNLVRDEYHPATQTTTVTHIDPVRADQAVRTLLPPYRAAVVRSTDQICQTQYCGYVSIVVPPENACPDASAANDARCSTDEGSGSNQGDFRGTPVGGRETLRALGLRPTAAAEDALRRGGVVVYDPAQVRNGTVRFDVITEAAAAAAGDSGQPAVRHVQLPGAYVPTHGQAAGDALYSAAAATALGLTASPSTMLLHFDRLPTGDEEDAARAALLTTGADTYSFSVERGYTSEYGLGLLALVVGCGVITLGAAGVATGLAQADARADHATLAAVGAAPLLRRTLAAAQALTIALLGTALGIAAGFVPALALIGAVQSLHVVVPWLRLATVLVVIPLLAGGLAWVLTRSRVPLERRVG